MPSLTIACTHRHSLGPSWGRHTRARRDLDSIDGFLTMRCQADTRCVSFKDYRKMMHRLELRIENLERDLDGANE